MFPREMLAFTALVCAFLQVASIDNEDIPAPSGLARLAVNSVKGVSNVFDSGANTAASGVELGATTLSNGLSAVGGAADLATNTQNIKFNAARKARRAAGKFGESLTDFGSDAVAGAFERGAGAIDTTKNGAVFTIGEADKVNYAGKKIAKSVLSNTSGSIVNALNGVDKVVTSTGEVREEVADGAGAIHDASTDLVKEGVKTWKDLSLAQLNSFKESLQALRKLSFPGLIKPAEKILENSNPNPYKKEPEKKQNGWGWW